MSKSIKNISNITIIPDGSAERFIFFGNVQAGERYNLQLLIGGISNLAPGYSVIRHNWQSHEILLLLEGELNVCPGSGNQTMSQGDVAFLPASMPHIYRSEKVFKMIWFHISPELLPFDSTAAFFLRQAGYFNEIRLLAELLYYEERRNPERAEISGNSLLEYLRLELRVNNRQHRHFHRISKVYEDIRNKLNHSWTLAEMAHRAYMSEANFFLVTKELYNTSPQEILKKMRMELAASLLIQSNFDLETIAAKIGYASSFSLSKAFRKYYQCCPRDFRVRRRYPPVISASKACRT